FVVNERFHAHPSYLPEIAAPGDADYQSRKNKRTNDRFDQIQENVAKKVDVVPPFRPYPPDRDADKQPDHNLRSQRWTVPGARWAAHGNVFSHAKLGLTPRRQRIESCGAQC